MSRCVYIGSEVQAAVGPADPGPLVELTHLQGSVLVQLFGCCSEVTVNISVIRQEATTRSREANNVCCTKELSWTDELNDPFFRMWMNFAVLRF